MGERADFVRSAYAPGDVAAVSHFGSDAADPEIIAGEIEQTRGEMSETIAAISQRLDPDRLSEQAVSAAAEMTEQAREAAKEVTEQAVTAATEVTEQARDAAKDVAKYAIEEAKSAVNELAAQAKASVREATVGRVEHVAAYTRDTAESVKGDLFSTIKQNPVPAMIAAIGIGWLWSSRSGGASGSSRGISRDVSSDWNRQSGYAGSPGYGSYRNDSGRHDHPGSQVQQMAGQVASQVQEQAGHMQQMAGQIPHQMQERAGHVQELAGQIPHQMQERAARVQQQAQGLWHMVEANPVVVGALGAVLGGVAGLMIPATERENEVMGQSRDRVIGSVQEVAGQTLEKVQRVAEEAGHTAMEEAKSQGMMPGGGSASGSGASAS